MAQGDLIGVLKTFDKFIRKAMEEVNSEAFRAERDRQTHILELNPQKIKNEILIQIQELLLSTQQERKDGNLGQAIRKAEGSKVRSPKIMPNARKLSSEAVQAYAAKPLSKELMADVDSVVSIIMAIPDKSLTFLDKKKIPKKVVSGSRASNLTYNSSALSKRSVVQGVGVAREDELDINTNLPNGVIRITYTNESGKASIFDAINRTIVLDAKKAINDLIIKKHFQNENAEALTRRFFNLGHVTAVSTLKLGQQLYSANKALTRISKKMAPLAATQAANTFRINILSKFTDVTKISRFGKKFEMEVILESEAANLTDSDYERALLEDYKRAIAETLKNVAQDPFWADQKSSDSFNESLTKMLLTSALGAAGKKVPTNLALSVKPNKASSAKKRIKRPKPKQPKIVSQTSASLGNLNLRAPRQQTSPVSMQNLIPMLNQKLPDLVKSNMGKNGALHNRTGRFAESVEVLSISGDGLNVGFTYQTDPYAVFESQGNRDPRRLIDVSIRQAAAGIMNVRFSTGRVR